MILLALFKRWLHCMRWLLVFSSDHRGLTGSDEAGNYQWIACTCGKVFWIGPVRDEPDAVKEAK